jgi:hypothetical protein
MEKTDTTCNDSEERHFEFAPPQSPVSEKNITRVFSMPSKPGFLNRLAAARYRALASIIPGRENLSF